MLPSVPKIKVYRRMIGQNRERTFRSVEHRGEISTSLAKGSNFVGLQRGINVDIEVRILHTSHFAFRIIVGLSLKVLFC